MLAADSTAASSENPVSSHGEPSGPVNDTRNHQTSGDGFMVWKDMEEALDGLQAGRVTSAEVVVTMERVVQHQIEAAHQHGSQLDMFIRSSIGRLSMAPTNWCETSHCLQQARLKSCLLSCRASSDVLVQRLTATCIHVLNRHQMVVYYLAQPEHIQKDNIGMNTPLMVLGSCTMVVMQIVVATATDYGASRKVCVDSDTCSHGRFCATGFNGRCSYCGTDAPILFTDEAGVVIYDAPSLPDFQGFNKTVAAQLCANPGDGHFFANAFAPEQKHPAVESYVVSWCSACVSMVTGDVISSTPMNMMHENTSAM
eukprot:COSAG06_NODE_477_length_15216_cov_133.572402_11_plen_312_part_00